MKRLTLLICILIMLGETSYAQKKVEQPEFIHTTYSVGGSLSSEKEIELSDYENFQFIYLMAAPQWNMIDFDAPIESIYNNVSDFDYGKKDHGMSLIPLMIEKAHNVGTKVLLSFAGEGFNPIVEEPVRRNKFVKFMVRLIDKFNYDGIEIDWETGVELNLHAVLMHEIRVELNKLSENRNKRYYYLTTALHYFQKYDQKLADKVSQDVDWINIMTYDMGGGIWGSVPTHNTPFMEIKSSLVKWNVFKREQLCIGLANYGFQYKNVMPGEKVEGRLDKYGRYLGYNEFLILQAKGWTEKYDEQQQVPYYFSPDGKEFVTMEKAETILEKIKWIKSQGYRGAFWWEFHYDLVLLDNLNQKATHHLINVVSDFLDSSNQ